MLGNVPDGNDVTKKHQQIFVDVKQQNQLLFSVITHQIWLKMSDSEDENPDKQLKIVVMGDGASGKVVVNG